MIDKETVMKALNLKPEDIINQEGASLYIHYAPDRLKKIQDMFTASPITVSTIFFPDGLAPSSWIEIPSSRRNDTHEEDTKTVNDFIRTLLYGGGHNQWT